MHHGGSDPRLGESGTEGRHSDSDDVKCRSWSSQWVLHLTVVALFLTSYGYDPYLRGQELQQTALEEDDDGVLLSVRSDFHDPEEEDPSEEAIEIQYHALLYVPRILSVMLLTACHKANVSIDLLQKIVHFGHPVVALLYTLLYLPDYLSYELRYIGCLSELFWSSKLSLYAYQLALCSPTAERLYYLIAGALALSLGSATHPLVAELGATHPIVSQYMLNLAVTLLQLGIYQPIMICGPCVSREDSSNPARPKNYARLNLFMVEILVATVALNSVMLQWFLTDNTTLLRPFLPFLSSDDLVAVFWQLFYVAIVFSTLGLLLIYLRTSDLMVACFGGQLLAGALYFYLEEPIAARFGLIMNTCSLATALEQLYILCGNGGRTVSTLGLTFTLINLQTYAFFCLLLTLWSSPDIVIVVVLAFNGFFALVLIVFRKWLNCEPTRHDPVEKMFSTQITTIT
ncbi:uncharacterized protein LOC118508530 [Anopheles stephensi]|uniref:uncharacterized protein LOC118508530 n=1 Tax=Anopheles stephensi TaxID=30069 RepID=UPI0016587DA7|nr:uncharacterized protein LOC118508530 [Anopheles stephensi]